VPAHLAVTLIVSDDVLPDWYDDWLDTERERFRQIRLHALERLCERLTVERRFGEALQAGLAALRTEPLRESAHRAMIGMHLAEGNLGEAVRQYEACERLLWSQLGVKPARQTSELIDDGMSARNGRRRRARSTWRSARQPPARRRTGRAARPRRDPDRRAS
jgi:DNA-binding SARP family transcriptional activator